MAAWPSAAARWAGLRGLGDTARSWPLRAVDCGMRDRRLSRFNMRPAQLRPRLLETPGARRRNRSKEPGNRRIVGSQRHPCRHVCLVLARLVALFPWPANLRGTDDPARRKPAKTCRNVCPEPSDWGWATSRAGHAERTDGQCRALAFR